MDREFLQVSKLHRKYVFCLCFTFRKKSLKLPFVQKNTQCLRPYGCCWTAGRHRVCNPLVHRFHFGYDNRDIKRIYYKTISCVLSCSILNSEESSFLLLWEHIVGWDIPKSAQPIKQYTYVHKQIKTASKSLKQTKVTRD